MNVKAGVLHMVSAMHGIEETFLGALDNEVVLDPIAIYVEIDSPGSAK